MIEIDRFTDILGELADELPECFFDRLNSGITVSENVKYHEKSREDDLYVMGEYRESPLERGITIYYGSFMLAYPGLTEGELRLHMRRTLRHEFTHHMESLAGEKGLEEKDARDIARYLSRFAD